MNKKINYLLLLNSLLGALFFSGCSTPSPIKGSDRVLIARNSKSDEITTIGYNILTQASRFKSNYRASRSTEEVLGALQLYRKEISPFLTDSFAQEFQEYVNTKLLAFQTKGPASRFDRAQDDPILHRRWAPDVTLMNREYSEEPKKSILVFYETLLNGKIYSGYQGESKLIFKRVGREWLLDNIVVRRRYRYKGSTWDEPINIRSKLRKQTQIYARDIIPLRKTNQPNAYL